VKRRRVEHLSELDRKLLECGLNEADWELLERFEEELLLERTPSIDEYAARSPSHSDVLRTYLEYAAILDKCERARCGLDTGPEAEELLKIDRMVREATRKARRGRRRTR
jgi:hypothetical protein